MSEPGPRAILRFARPVAALGLLLVLVAALRGANLVSAAVLNPDEAELLAMGRRAALNLWPYVTYTTSTFQVLWPASLGFLGILGVPLVLQTAHVLSGLAYAWIAFTGWWVMARGVGWLAAAIFVLPPTAIVLIAPGPQPVDFLSLGTELLPVSILMLAGLVLLGPGEPPGERRLAASAFLVGLAPLAKPQAVVVAASLWLVVLLVRRLPVRDGDPVAEAPAGATRPATRSLRRDVVIAAAAFAAPTALLLVAVLVAGRLQQFIDEPVAYIYSYIRFQGTQTATGAPLTIADRLAVVSEALGWFPAAFVPAVPGVLAVAVRWRRLAPSARAVSILAVAAPAGAALLSIAVLSPIFPHYLNLLFGGSMLSGMAGTAVARFAARREEPRGAGVPGSQDGRRVGRGRALVVGAVTGIAAVASLAAAIGGMGHSPGVMAANVDAVAAAATGRGPAAAIAPSTVRDACPAHARVLVWGWAAELYAEFDWVPASRFVAWWPITYYGRPRIYRVTLERELRADPPACVVEAIAPVFYGYYDQERDTIAARIPSLEAWLAGCYARSSETLPGDRPVTLWRRTGPCAPAG